MNEKIPFRKQLNLLSLKARFRVQEMSKNFSHIKLNKTQKNENINKLTFYLQNNFLSKNLKKKSLDKIVEYEKLCSNKVNFVHENLEKSSFYTKKLPILKKNKSVIINLHKKKNNSFFNLKKNSYNDININNYENNSKTTDSINEKNQKKIYKNLSYFNIFPQIIINNNNKHSKSKKQKEKIIQNENINDFIYYKLNNKQFYNELNCYNKKYCIKL